MKIRTAFIIVIAIIIGYNYHSEIGSLLEFAKTKIHSVLLDDKDLFSSNNYQKKDKNGLYPKNYDKNGWAQLPSSEWVPNPNGKVVYRYTDTQKIATASKPISSMIVNSNTPIKASRNFSSIEETYPLLRRVAEDLQYSDLEALQNSFRK